MAALRAGMLTLRMAKCLARPVDLESQPLSTLAFPPHGLPWLSLVAVARFQECLKRQEVGAASSGGLGPEAGTAPLLPYSFVKESRGQAPVEQRRLLHHDSRISGEGESKNWEFY